MKHAFTVFYRSLYDVYQNLGVIIRFTLLWWVCVLPLFTLFPATAGLLYTLKKKRMKESVTSQHFIYAFKRYFGVGLRLHFMYLIVTIPGIFYLYLLLQGERFIAYFIAMVIVYVLSLWHLLLLYTLPLMVEQDITKLLILLKRALRLASENIVFTLNIALYLIIILLLCSVITIALVLVTGWLAMTMYNALLFLLQKYDQDRYHFDPHVKWKGIWKSW